MAAQQSVLVLSLLLTVALGLSCQPPSSPGTDTSGADICVFFDSTDAGNNLPGMFTSVNQQATAAGLDIVVNTVEGATSTQYPGGLQTYFNLAGNYQTQAVPRMTMTSTTVGFEFLLAVDHNNAPFYPGVNQGAIYTFDPPGSAITLAFPDDPGFEAFGMCFYGTQNNNNGEPVVEFQFSTGGTLTYPIPQTAATGDVSCVVVFADSGNLITGVLLESTVLDFFTMDNFYFGVVAADPHFTGFLGQEFDFHGLPGKIIALFSDIDIQVNALVSAPLDASLYVLGESVTIMTKIGISFADNFALEWHAMPKRLFVLHPELPMVDGQIVLPNGAGVIRYIDNERSGIEIEFAGRYVMAINSVQDVYNSDQWFIDFSVRLIGSPASQDTHGVLGQTLHENKVMSSTGPQGEGLVEGTMRDYFVSSLLASDFSFTAFEARMVPVEARQDLSAAVSSSDVILH